MATEELQIAYAGEAPQTGEMNVRELAPALLAIAALCQEANAILNRDQANIAVNVKAVDRGSFQLNLILDQVPTIKNPGSLFLAI